MTMMPLTIEKGSGETKAKKGKLMIFIMSPALLWGNRRYILPNLSGSEGARRESG